MVCYITCSVFKRICRLGVRGVDLDLYEFIFKGFLILVGEDRGGGCYFGI